MKKYLEINRLKKYFLDLKFSFFNFTFLPSFLPCHGSIHHAEGVTLTMTAFTVTGFNQQPRPTGVHPGGPE
jgi:hypothetical protein